MEISGSQWDPTALRRTPGHSATGGRHSGALSDGWTALLGTQRRADELVQCESILSAREELVAAALEAHLRGEPLLAVHRPRLLGSDEAEQLELDHDGALPCQRKT